MARQMGRRNCWDQGGWDSRDHSGYNHQLKIHGAGLSTLTLHTNPGETLESIQARMRVPRGTSTHPALEHAGRPLYPRRTLEEQSVPRGAALYSSRSSLNSYHRERKSDQYDMHQAVLWDDGFKVQQLLDDGYRLETAGIDGHGPLGTLYGGTALHWASLCLSINSVVVLLRAGAQTEARCREAIVTNGLGGATTLEWATPTQIATAAASGRAGSDRGILAQLRLHGSDANAGCWGRAATATGTAWAGGATSLHLANTIGDTYTTCSLMELNADLDAHAISQYPSVETARNQVEGRIQELQLCGKTQPASFCDRFNSLP